MTTATVHVKTSLSRNFILSIVFAFLRMKQEVERDRVRDVLVDGRVIVFVLIPGRTPEASRFSKLYFFSVKLQTLILGLLTIYVGKPKIPFRWKAS